MLTGEQRVSTNIARVRLREVQRRVCDLGAALASGQSSTAIELVESISRSVTEVSELLNELDERPAITEGV